MILLKLQTLANVPKYGPGIYLQTEVMVKILLDYFACIFMYQIISIFSINIKFKTWFSDKSIFYQGCIFHNSHANKRYFLFI